MKSFELRRHSIKDGGKGTIGPKGYALGREVGRQQLRGRGFTHFFCSALWRTQQTLAAFDEGAGDFRCRDAPLHAPFYLDWPELADLWRHCHASDARGEDMLVTALRHDGELTRRAVTEITRRFEAWVPTLPENARVLIVGHSPSMEMIPLGLRGLQIPSLKECQGFRIDIRAQQTTIVIAGDNLDPHAIRQALHLDSP